MASPKSPELTIQEPSQDKAAREDRTAGRYEKKYVVTELCSSEIELMIKQNSALFSEVFAVRRINNIYLDSVNLDNYKEHLAGVPERLKIRIRWYGETFGKVSNPILELKIKNNQFGKKQRFNLKPFMMDDNFNQKVLHKVFSTSALPKWLSEELSFLQPTLLNSYIRKYFLSADRKCRITIDKNVVFFKLRKNENRFTEKVDYQGMHIIELKYSVKDEEKADLVASCLPFRLTAFSKYVQGIRNI